MFCSYAAITEKTLLIVTVKKTAKFLVPPNFSLPGGFTMKYRQIQTIFFILSFLIFGLFFNISNSFASWFCPWYFFYTDDYSSDDSQDQVDDSQDKEDTDKDTEDEYDDYIMYRKELAIKAWNRRF